MAIKDLRNSIVGVRLTEEEYKAINDLAEREERTLSDTARRLIKKGLESYNHLAEI